MNAFGSWEQEAFMGDGVLSKGERHLKSVKRILNLKPILEFLHNGLYEECKI